MLNVLHEWTDDFDMSVNIDKTKMVYSKVGPSIDGVAVSLAMLR